MAGGEDNQTKHLEMIQGVISRMAGNSFLIRGWSVTLVAAIVALAIEKDAAWFGTIALLPVICFWCLDAYYQSLEDQFCALFDAVRKANNNVEAFDMNPKPYKRVAGGMCSKMLHSVVGAYHLPILGVIAAFLIFVAVTEGWSELLPSFSKTPATHESPTKLPTSSK